MGLSSHLSIHYYYCHLCCRLARHARNGKIKQNRWSINFLTVEKLPDPLTITKPFSDCTSRPFQAPRALNQ